MKSYFRMFSFLLAVCMIFSLAACVETPTESGSKPSVSSEPTNNVQNVQRIDEMVGKLESAAAAATTNLKDAVAVLTADYEATQKDAGDAVAQMNAAYSARTTVLTAQIQTLKNVDTNNAEAVAVAIAEAEALIAEESHIYGDPIEHSRTSDHSSCDEKDIYQICTICNALKWGKMEHSLELCYDMSMHWNCCMRCDKAMPRWKHNAGVDGQCTECPCVVNANILILEKYAGESETLCGMIDGRHTVNVLNVANAPASMEELARYDEVILVNVRYSDMPAGFEELLHRYVQEMGGGLLTVGGENEVVDGQLTPYAYNRADIARSTYYKNMLPVHVQDFSAPAAVMVVIDISGSMTNGKDVVARDAALAIVEALDQQDYCGVMTMRHVSEIISPVVPMSQKDELVSAIMNLQDPFFNGQGGTIFTGAFLKAAESLVDVENVEHKQIILITDGDPGDKYEVYAPYIEENKSNGITTSVITVYQDNEEKQEDMQAIAELGGGKYFNIVQEEIGMMPIYIMEKFASEIVSPIRYGKAYALELGGESAVVEDLDPALLPALTGCYVTQLKNGAIAPLVSGWMPIYAQWQYGKGHVASFLCDLNGNWSADFVVSESAASLLDTILVILANEAEEDETTEAGA